MDVLLGSKYAFEGILEDAPREELAIGPVVECLATTAWQKNHQ